MNTPIRTLIIGFIPFSDTAGKKPRELRDDQYFKELLASHDIGEVHYTTHENRQQKLDEVNPLFTVVFNEDTARFVQTYKKGSFVYLTNHPSSIFYRKAEIEAKKIKQREIFEEIARLIQKIRNDGEEQFEAARKFAGMSYNDLYQMLKQAIISDRKELSDRAWEILRSNDLNPCFIWMRAQLITEIWQAAEAKDMENFLCMVMRDHADNGFAHQLSDFTDLDGQVFHQYMFHYSDGTEANYIRRIPVATPGQGKYGYVSLLEKYETPNGIRMMIEVGQMKKQKAEIIADQRSKKEST